MNKNAVIKKSKQHPLCKQTSGKQKNRKFKKRLHERPACNCFIARGYVYDVETGFCYLDSRYYSNKWSRFLNVDEYIDRNSFIYATNNCINYLDDNGKEAILVAYSVSKTISLIYGGFYALLFGFAIGNIRQRAYQYSPSNTIDYNSEDNRHQILPPPPPPCPTATPSASTTLEYREHTKNKRKSTQEKHENANARRKRDSGGEKGDLRRRKNRSNKRSKLYESFLYNAVEIDNTVQIIVKHSSGGGMFMHNCCVLREK